MGHIGTTKAEVPIVRLVCVSGRGNASGAIKGMFYISSPQSRTFSHFKVMTALNLNELLDSQFEKASFQQTSLIKAYTPRCFETYCMYILMHGPLIQSRKVHLEQHQMRETIVHGTVTCD